jgi:hypothetical protein
VPTVRCVRHNPADPESGLKLFSNGVIQPFGNAIAPSDWEIPSTFTDTSAWDMQVIDYTTPALYVLSGRGTIFAVGGVTPATGFQDSGGFAIFRAIHMNPAGNGTGYEVDVRGRWWAVGTPRPANIGGPLTLVDPDQAGGIDWGKDIYADSVLDYASKRWAMLSTAGHLVSAPFTLTVTSPVRDLTLTESMYRALVFQEAGFPAGHTAGYIARRDGALFPFDSPEYTAAMAIGPFPNQDVIVDLAVISDGKSGRPLILEEATRDGRRKRVVVSSPPTITVAVDPAGPVTTTTRPTVTWTYTDPDGDAQASAEVRLYPDTGLTPVLPPSTGMIASWTVTGGLVFSQQIDRDLANGDYWAYVRATDTAGDTSDWEVVAWTQNVTPPPTPALTAVDPDSGTWATSVTVTAGTGTGAGFSGALEFSDDDGTTWERLADPIAYPSSGTKAVTFDDIEAPFNRTRLYRAQTVNALLGSAYSSSSGAILQSEDWVVTNPRTGDGSDVDAVPEWSHRRPSGGAALRAVGRRNAIVVRDAAGVGGRTFALTLHTANHAEHDALDALVGAGETLQIRNPFGESIYFGVVDDIDATLMDGAAPEPTEVTEAGYKHTHVLQAVEVDRP